MKKLFSVFFFILVFFSAYAQEAEKSTIHNAIENGNAKVLSSHFASGVDLMVDDAEGVYSKDQAELIVSRFFSDHTPNEFILKHQGKSKLDDYYYIGNLKTDNGDFRVTFFLKKEDKKFLLKQLRIEKL